MTSKEADQNVTKLHIVIIFQIKIIVIMFQYICLNIIFYK